MNDKLPRGIDSRSGLGIITAMIAMGYGCTYPAATEGTTDRSTNTRSAVVRASKAPTGPSRPSRPRHLTGELVVKMKPGKTPDRLSPMKAKLGVTGVSAAIPALAGSDSPSGLARVHRLKMAHPSDLATAISDLKAHPDVEYAEPVYLSYTDVTPNDPLFPQQWSHARTKAALGWDAQQGDSATVIAVVDTGVDYQHPDLAPNIWKDASGNPGADFVDIDTAQYESQGFELIAGEDYVGVDQDPSDVVGHGTHCAGIAAAAMNNRLGIAGVCPKCAIMPIRAGFAMRFYGQDLGLLDSVAIAQGIVFAADHGAKIISMSFGGSDLPQVEADAIAYAAAKGIVLVASAGNDNRTVAPFPAGSSSVMAIAATQGSDAKAFYSNYGSWVSVAAPGGDNLEPILSTVPRVGVYSDPSGYKGLFGTSMAAPYVAGLAGLVLSKLPRLSPLAVRRIIEQGVDAFGVDLADPGSVIGTGRVNVQRTLAPSSASLATVQFSSPVDDFLSGNTVEFRGTASAPYGLSYGMGRYPTSFLPLASGPAVTNGLLGTAGPSAFSAAFSGYVFKLVVADPSGRAEAVIRGDVGTQFLAGWPRSFSDRPVNVWHAPTVADVNLDGNAELIVAGASGAGDATINVLKKDGSSLQGWPQVVPAANLGTFQTGAAVGDVDNDGAPEIVAGLQAFYPNPGRLYAWNNKGGLLWSQQLGAGSPMNVTLADLNGDRANEIVVETSDDGTYGSLHALDGHGNLLWSKPLADYFFVRDDYPTVAAADLDGDGKEEVAVPVATLRVPAPDFLYSASLMILNGNGSTRWQHTWPEAGDPTSTSFIPRGSPVLGDLNHDGRYEILLRVQVQEPETSTRLYAFDDKGVRLAGWPVILPGVSGFGAMALGDVNGDGYPELVGTTEAGLFAIRRDGVVLYSSIDVGAASDIAIADVVGDGIVHAFVRNKEGYSIVMADGAVVSHAFDGSGDSANVVNMPVLMDFDRNGVLDLVSLASGKRPMAYAWNLGTAANPSKEEWTQYAADARHSNRYQPKSSPACSPRCPQGSTCQGSGDCMSHVCTGGLCRACSPTCNQGAACSANQDCASKVCNSGACQRPSCSPHCNQGTGCGADADCGSGVCTGGLCRAPACSPTCAPNAACGVNADCASLVCAGNVCKPPSCSSRCNEGAACGVGSDCITRVCSSGRCAAPVCSPRCAMGAACGMNSECISKVCASGMCQ